MNFIRKVLVACIVIVLCPVAGLGEGGADHLAPYRDAVMQLGRELKGRLQKALQEDGPVSAISVCRRSAPEIAERLSREKGFYVGRRALKARNRENRPDAWEKKVLETFVKRRHKGEDPSAMEYNETVILEDGRKVVRYMKAIPTGGLCLICHGETISPDIAGALQAHYPLDRATGFKKGDIRGAFTVMQLLK